MSAINYLFRDWFDETGVQPWIDYLPAGGETATIAWTEADDTAAIAVDSSSTAAISWTEADDAAAIAIASASASSLAWTEQDDSAAINVTSGRTGGGYSGKRKYVRRIGDRLVVFSSAEAAMNSFDDDQAEAIEVAQPAKKLPKDAEIVQEMPIAQIRQVAKRFDVTGAVNTMLAQAQYNALMSYVMELQREQDDEEAILLLMA